MQLKEGKSVSDIAKSLNVSEHRVYQIKSRYNVSETSQKDNETNNVSETKQNSETKRDNETKQDNETSHNDNETKRLSETSQKDNVSETSHNDNEIVLDKPKKKRKYLRKKPKLSQNKPKMSQKEPNKSQNNLIILAIVGLIVGIVLIIWLKKRQTGSEYPYGQ